MADPSLDIQKAIIAKLKASSGVSDLVAARVYDDVPPNATFPYISYGPDFVQSDDPSCIVSYDISIQIDVWSRTPGQPEMKRIAGAVREALRNVDLELDAHQLVLIEHETSRYLDDPDGVTKHGVLTFHALIDA